MRIARLTASYGTLTVLRDVSIDIRRGHTIAVVGESGSGKTTLARVVAGLLRPVGGSISFGGAILPSHIRQRDRSTLQAIQMIYQSADSSLNPRHTVEKIVGRPLRLYRHASGDIARREVRELLDMVGLSDQIPRAAARRAVRRRKAACRDRTGHRGETATYHLRRNHLRT